MPQFRLVPVIYLVSLLAVSMATFGGRGLIPGSILSVFWSVVYTSRTRAKAFKILGTALMLGFGWWAMWKGCSDPPEATRSMMCANNLKQIALALHNYHDVYKCFPPAYVADSNGKPMHSWRVLILPFLEQQAIYNAYHFDQPWDSPSNRQLLSSISSVLRCPSRRAQSTTSAAYTDYFAVVGPTAAWPGSVGRKLTEFPDDKSMTILVVEVAGQNVLWSEPRDLTFEEATKLVNSRDPLLEGCHRYDGMFRDDVHAYRHITMCDGSVQTVLELKRFLI